MVNLTFQAVRDPLASAAFFDEEQAGAHDCLESMSRVSCALIFQSARDLVCSRRVLQSSRQRRPKAVRKAEQFIEEITKWANTVFPLLYEDGGMSLAGAIATINRYQDQRGVRRLEYHVVKQLLLTKPQRLAIVDGPAEFRTLTNDVDELADAVSAFRQSERQSQITPAKPPTTLAV